MPKSKWFAYASDNNNSKLNLFCFPYAGGSASLFVYWKKYFGSEVNVYPVLYPFRETRRSERMPDTIQQLAMEFVDDNEEMLKSGKFAFFAHCAGASIAYEVIIYARKKLGIEPEFIIVSGAETPNNSLSAFADMSDAGDDEFLQYLINSHFVEPDIVNNKGFLTYYIPIIREDFKSLFKYSMTKADKLSCPIYSFCGQDDKVIEIPKLSEWEDFTSAETIFRQFTGDHYYFTKMTEEICEVIYGICKNYF